MAKNNTFSCPGAEFIKNNPNFVFNAENNEVVNKVGQCVGRYYFGVFAIESCNSLKHGICMPVTREGGRCPLPIAIGFRLGE